MKPMNSAAPMPDLAQPCVMGILNVTPDSFYAGSRRTTREAVEQRAREIVDEGAAIIDIGGYSSRPGADEVPVEEEWRRVALGLEAVRRVAPGAAVSVDTFRSEMVERAVAEFGAVTVNGRTYTVPSNVPCYNLETDNWVTLTEARQYADTCTLYIHENMVRFIEVG